MHFADKGANDISRRAMVAIVMSTLHSCSLKLGCQKTKSPAGRIIASTFLLSSGSTLCLVFIMHVCLLIQNCLSKLLFIRWVGEVLGVWCDPVGFGEANTCHRTSC